MIDKPCARHLNLLEPGQSPCGTRIPDPILGAARSQPRAACPSSTSSLSHRLTRVLCMHYEAQLVCCPRIPAETKHKDLTPLPFDVSCNKLTDCAVPAGTPFMATSRVMHRERGRRQTTGSCAGGILIPHSPLLLGRQFRASSPTRGYRQWRTPSNMERR